MAICCRFSPNSRRSEQAIGRYRSVIRQPVVPSDNPEADDMALVVKDLEPLRAGIGGKARDDVDLSEGTHVAVSEDDVAALEEVLVGLGVVEPADDGPDGGDGGVYGLHDDGAALVGTHHVVVVTCYAVRDR
ncbi:hypothetical protein RJ641_005719 [Dillenia turbinata]|uniref:Uncharacterized protein n=1 Tax=Dillenia turbinata TaxID=194707 RepID=A0AAN8V9W9_9MAGN